MAPFIKDIKSKGNKKYILSFICFGRMDFSEQYHIKMRNPLRKGNINDSMFIDDLSR